MGQGFESLPGYCKKLLVKTRSFFDLAHYLLTHALLMISVLCKFEIVLRSIFNGQKESNIGQAELELLKEGLKRSYKERFEMATRLYKIQQTMSKVSISHKPFISK